MTIYQDVQTGQFYTKFYGRGYLLEAWKKETRVMALPGLRSDDKLYIASTKGTVYISKDVHAARYGLEVVKTYEKYGAINPESLKTAQIELSSIKEDWWLSQKDIEGCIRTLRNFMKNSNTDTLVDTPIFKWYKMLHKISEVPIVHNLHNDTIKEISYWFDNKYEVNITGEVPYLKLHIRKGENEVTWCYDYKSYNSMLHDYSYIKTTISYEKPNYSDKIYEILNNV